MGHLCAPDGARRDRATARRLRAQTGASSDRRSEIRGPAPPAPYAAGGITTHLTSAALRAAENAVATDANPGREGGRRAA